MVSAKHTFVICMPCCYVGAWSLLQACRELPQPIQAGVGALTSVLDRFLVLCGREVHIPINGRGKQTMMHVRNHIHLSCKKSVLQASGVADGAAKQDRTRAAEDALRKELHFQVCCLSCQTHWGAVM